MKKWLLVSLAMASLTCSTNTSGTGVGSGGAPGSDGRDAGAGGSPSSGSGGGTASGTGGGTASGTGGANGGGGRGGGAGRAATGGATATGGRGGSAGAPAGTGGAVVTGGGASVLQHHNNATRDGVYLDARLTRAAAGTLHADATFGTAALMGPVYAQPLYLAGANGGPDLIIAATAQNRVYAINAATGAEAWNRQVGTPVTAGLCGAPLNPLGITGTPVIDGATRTLYLDAMTSVSANNPHHMVHALDLANMGAERAGWPVDLDATARSGGTAFSSAPQNQRAALVLLGGRVFVPFGGHIGDCQGYHGWIVGVSTTDPTSVNAWATTAFAGGIWGSSGIASDGTSLYVTTGNTKAMATSGGIGSSPTDWGGGEAALKFGPTLVQAPLTTTTDYFFPADWAAMDRADADLGGTGPVLFTVPGATPSDLMMALGKDRKAYLLNRANLGGMDAQPLAGRTGVAGTQIINAAAAYTTSTGTYVVFKNGGATDCPAGQTGGLTAIRVAAGSPPTLAQGWCGGPTTSGSPMVTMTSTAGADAIVWVVGSDNRLYGVDGGTGQNVFTGTTAMGTVRAHQSPIAANGRIFVASDTRIFAYAP